jgi:AcrR family transcriptional regulator
MRMSAEERREQVLSAAMAEFARGGYEGTTADSIASRAGVSQPYLFKLFPGKHAIFLECIDRSFQYTEDELRAVPQGSDGTATMRAMGVRYRELLTDTTWLRFQQQAYASAGSDPQSREIVIRRWARSWRLVREKTARPPIEIIRFLANGSLATLLASMEFPVQLSLADLAVWLDAWADQAEQQDTGSPPATDSADLGA